MIVYNVVERGTYFRAYEFAHYLTRFGHSVTLMATSKDSRFKSHIRNSDGIQIIETPDLYTGPLRAGWDLYNAICRLRLVNSQEFDIVHAFETRPVVLFPALKLRWAGVPLVLDWCDWYGRGGSVEERPDYLVRTILRPVETFFEEHFRTKAAATTVICSTLYQRAQELGVNEKTITIIPNGFDITGWEIHTKKKARELLGFNKNDFIIAYVGSLFSQDAQLMAEAFDLICAKIPEAKLLHTGKGKYDVMALVAHPERIIKTGGVSLAEMSLNLSACDVGWLPFRDTNANRGRFPMKFSNYIAAGKPVIATDVGDVAQYIRETGVGMVVEDAASSLAGAVYMLKSDRGKQIAFEQAAIKLSEDKQFNWESRARQVERVYLSITEGKYPPEERS
ncbi:MAG: glycosyltransferase [Chloroflexota bacterium]